MNESTLAFWKKARAARIPLASLGQLDLLRDRTDVRVTEEADQAWVSWEEPWEPVIESLLAIPGVLYFEPWEDRWLPLGKQVPVSVGPPSSGGRLLGSILVPEPLVGIRPAEAIPPAFSWKLVPGGKAQTATALKCSLADLFTWAQGVPDSLIEDLQGALWEDEVLIRGERLPVILRATRFYGKRVWLPLGYQGDPDLPEESMIGLAGKRGGGILVCGETDQQWIPDEAFAQLGRAAIQMGWRNRTTERPRP